MRGSGSARVCEIVDSVCIIYTLWSLIHCSQAEDGYCKKECVHPSLSECKVDIYTTWGCMCLSHLYSPVARHSQHIKNSFSFWLVRRSLLTMHLQVSAERVRVTPSLMHPDTHTRKLRRKLEDTEMQDHYIYESNALSFSMIHTLLCRQLYTQLYMSIIGRSFPMFCHLQNVVTSCYPWC